MTIDKEYNQNSRKVEVLTMQKTIQLLKQFTILYVENDKETAKETLTLYNAIFKKVYYFNNGKDALELFKKYHDEIDLTITNVETPILSGIQMVRFIRQNYGYEHAIMFSLQNTNDDILLKCLKLGAIDYIIKPILHQTHLGVLIKVLKPIYNSKKLYSMNQELEIYKKSADTQLLISKTNLEGIITYVNDNFCTVSQYSQDELLGQEHSIIKHPDMKNDIFKDLWHTIICGNNWSGTIQNKAKDGSSYYVVTSIYPIKDEYGKLIEFISFRQDITQYITQTNNAKQLLKETKLNYSKVYAQSIVKAKNSVKKEMQDLEYIVNLERENAKKHISKRASAEIKLNETTDEKNKEIQKWKYRVREASSTMEKIRVANKRLTNESRNFNMNIEINEKKLSHTQTKVFQLQNDKDELRKIIEDREDVIKHLEEELVKGKRKKLW